MNTKTSFKVGSVDGLQDVVEHIIELVHDGPQVVFLNGDLGAGKTTLVKAIAGKLGTTDDTSSPTYALVNEYEIAKGSMYHIDLYRINDTHEAIDMGIEDYIYSKKPCFVEWPEVIKPLVDSYINIDIQVDESKIREVTVTVVES